MRCSVCGREIKSKDSLASGMGPVCAKKMQDQLQQEEADIPGQMTIWDIAGMLTPSMSEKNEPVSGSDALPETLAHMGIETLGHMVEAALRGSGRPTREAEKLLRDAIDHYREEEIDGPDGTERTTDT